METPGQRKHGAAETAGRVATDATAGRGIDAGERHPGREADGRRRGPAEKTGGRRPDVGLAALTRKLDDALGAERVDRYFRRDARLSVDGTSLIVAVPSPFHAGLIERRFGGLLRDIVTESFGPGFRFEVRVEQDKFTAAGAQPAGVAGAVAGAGPTKTRRVATRKASAGSDAIDERFDLDRFLVGASNRTAFDAAVRVAEGAVDDAYSRLFLHGPCGVGKSHLLRGIARRRSGKQGGSVRCVSAEVFTNEYIQAVQHGRVDSFRRRYRRLDLLCIDDVHFLAGKNATQVELLHTLDTIELGAARLVLASDEHPHRIAELSKALSSRFVSGMVIEIEAPDADLRDRLLREMAHRRGIGLTDQAIASLREGRGRHWSAREIQGVMTRLQAASTLEPFSGDSLGPDDVERILCGAARTAADTPVRYDQVRDTVCKQLEVESAELGRSGRHRRVVLARAMITLLCRELTTMSYPEIARALGKRNHSTVITAHRRIEEQMDEVIALGLAVDGISNAHLRDRLRSLIRSNAG
ncbi:MAG: DnaA/Hda family protein [Planctomycetota bacterium]